MQQRTLYPPRFDQPFLFKHPYYLSTKILYERYPGCYYFAFTFDEKLLLQLKKGMILNVMLVEYSTKKKYTFTKPVVGKSSLRIYFKKHEAITHNLSQGPYIIYIRYVGMLKTDNHIYKSNQSKNTDDRNTRPTNTPDKGAPKEGAPSKRVYSNLPPPAGSSQF